jgi:hypothetical protein
MSTYRIIVTLLIVTAVGLAMAIPAPAADQGPTLGKWEFSGKDNTGLAWSGTLKFEKLVSRL